MHQLAIALHRKGYKVTGTDDEIFEPARGNLAAEGLLPDTVGWQPELITNDIDAVILGMHAKPDNPELLKAREMGLTIYSFPEYIYHESRNKKRIVVGGSHGKTTTTSMIMHVLQAAGVQADYLVGAKVQGFAQSVNITDAPVIVCEGDEYPASAIEKKPKFHFLYPHVAILTGIAWDHINVFPTFDFYLEQFVIFINRIEKDGLLIYNETDPVLKDLVEKHRCPDIRYQPYGVPEHTISHGRTTVTINGVSGSLQVFGNHNLMNLYAAYYACKEVGVTAAQFLPAIGSFTGAAKRLELVAGNDHTIVYRDFAHAPSKVKATIDALKQQYPGRKLIGVLELHTYSSLNEKFLSEYIHTMDTTDEAIVYFSHHALGLKGLPVLEKEKVKSYFERPDLHVIDNRSTLENTIKDMVQGREKPTFLLLMSSGTFDGIDWNSVSSQ